MKYYTIEQYERELMKDPEFKALYEKEDDYPFEISEMVINARTYCGLTQKQLAELVGTKQSGIARLEKGTALPSNTLLVKIAKALKMILKYQMVAQEGSTRVAIDGHGIRPIQQAATNTVTVARIEDDGVVGKAKNAIVGAVRVNAKTTETSNMMNETYA